MEQSEVALSIGMISMRLPNGLGKSIIGSGCIVNLNVKGEERATSLITTTQVITKNDLLSTEYSVVVEFLDLKKRKLLTANLDNVADDVEVLPGRVLEGTGQSLKEISFLVISLENLVRGNAFTKFWKGLFNPLSRDSLKRRSLACGRGNDETLKQNISARQILCHVMCNKKNDEVATEPYCLEFEGDGCTEFALTSPLDNNRLDYSFNKVGDFNSEQRPRGAPLFSKQGEFLGMLAFEESERRFIPLFLSTVEMPTSVSSKENFNDTCGEVKGKLKASPEMPETDTSGSDDTDGNDIKESKENQNRASLNNNPSQRPGVESQENCLINSEVQGSGTSAGPLKLRGSTPEIPQPFPTTTENTNSDGNSLLSEQLEPQPVNEQIPAEQNRTSFSAESAQDDDLSSHESAPDVDTSLDNLAPSEDRISDESCKDCEEETSELPYHLQQQSTFNSDGTSTEDDDQLYQQIDSSRENIAADPPIRPALLMQNSYRDDREERPDNGEGGYQESGNPYPSELPTRTGYQEDPGTQQGRVLFVQPDSLVKDVIVSNTSAMDIISLHLDRSVHPGGKDVPVVQCWEHLADEFDMPDLTKKKCGNMSATLSPSEKMFQHLQMKNPSLPIADLKKCLEEVERKDVVEELNKNISLSSDDATVTDLWEKHFSTLSTVCIMLDDKDCPYNYKHLASRLGISASTLRKFKYGDSSESPSMVVLKKLETQKPNLSTDDMVVALNSLGLETIAKELKCRPPGTIQTLLDDLEGSEVITALLDEDDSYWFRFGHKFGIDRVILENLRPDPIKSPTKAMMKFIVSRNPDLQMRKFIEKLNKIEQNKLIEKLKTMFHFSWI